MQSTTSGAPAILRTIITLLLLLSGILWPPLFLLGLIIMWFWSNWPKRVKLIILIPAILLLALSAILSMGVLAYLFVMRPYQMNGNSMLPNYKNGAFVMTKIISPGNIAINRGDVVIFKSPQNKEIDYIKRVVGLPGETIMIKAGRVYIDGRELDEKVYGVTSQTATGTLLSEGQTMEIVPGQYFVLGDNRPLSKDSREFGLVPQQNIISKVAFCYWNCK